MIENKVSYESICGVLPIRIRKGIADWMRKWADRIDDDGAPRRMSYSFTFQLHEGIRFHDDGRGCPLWRIGEEDYKRAWLEADRGGE